MNVVSVMLFVGSLLSVWAVFSIDIPLITKIPCSFSEEIIDGVNRACQALAYSYIAGVIIYWMTIKYPNYLNKRRLTPVIKVKVGNLGSMLAWMNIEFRETGNNPPISDLDGIMALFERKRWKERCHVPEHSGCKDVTEEFIRDYNELKSMVDALINDYKEYLSGEQMIYLEAIRGSRLNQFFRSYEKSKGNCDYTDDFYKLVLQPNYRKLILMYYSLCKVSGINV
ncbi:hypothetical protein SAMN04487902_101330 [Prevotella sp. ne3005]|nr:hypothetical protein SAMN04487902_101330 [Prevotella sp. ne3005]